jgi:hypothetical protein
MNTPKDKSFYARLDKLFKSGPALQRKIKGQDYRAYYDNAVIQANSSQSGYSMSSGFNKQSSIFTVGGGYGAADRLRRYEEFAAMEYHPEVSSALDLFADESCSPDESGLSFHIQSDDQRIQAALEDLFYNVVNIEYDVRRWFRNLVKYGDFFAYVEVAPEQGVVKVEPLIVTMVERIEGFDKEDPYAVQFRVNQIGRTLKRWQMLHFRIVSNDNYLPYGTSFLESARRVATQLSLIEDAMLLYRIIRSPERRVFYIDVSAVKPEDVATYMEAVKEKIKGASVIDRQTGREEFRFNTMDGLEDYFLPTRQNSQTKIDTLAGGQHVSATEDVEYIQKKLFAALKVPKAYLSYDESLSSKATLSQIDIRFSRTITNLQKIFLAELKHLAILHLFAKGFDGKDLINFEIKFSNPSTVAVQQKLALVSARVDAAQKAWDLAKETGIYSLTYIQKEFLGLKDSDIQLIKKQAEEDQIRLSILKTMAQQEYESDATENGIQDTFANFFNSKNSNQDTQQLVSGSSQTMPEPKKDIESSLTTQPSTKNKLSSFIAQPIKPNASPKQRPSRANPNAPTALSMPDFSAMLNPNNKYTKDVFGLRTDKGGIDYGLLEEEIKEIINEEPVAYKTSKKRIPKNIGFDMTNLLKEMQKSLDDELEEVDIEVLTEGQDLIIEEDWNS